MHEMNPTGHYALRIEGRAWMDDLSLERAWSMLQSAYQPLQPRQELLFLMLLPNGEMPARCLPKDMFEHCMASPDRLAAALALAMPDKLLLSGDVGFSWEDEGDYQAG